MAALQDAMRVVSSLRDPDLGRNVVSLGMIKDPAIAGGNEIRDGAGAGKPAAAVGGSLQQAAFQALARRLAAEISTRAFRRLPVIQIR